PFHYEDMTTETIAAIDKLIGGPAHLIGWSDGGNVALLVALRRPDLVRSLVLIGSNYHFDSAEPAESTGSGPPRFIRERYAERSPRPSRPRPPPPRPRPPRSPISPPVSTRPRPRARPDGPLRGSPHPAPRRRSRRAPTPPPPSPSSHARWAPPAPPTRGPACP